MADEIMTVTDVISRGEGVFEFILTSKDEWTPEELHRFVGIEIPKIPPPPEPAP